jgi:hypothetical protein
VMGFGRSLDCSFEDVSVEERQVRVLQLINLNKDVFGNEFILLCYNIIHIFKV